MSLDVQRPAGTRIGPAAAGFVGLADVFVKPHSSGGHQVKGFYRHSITTEGGATHKITLVQPRSNSLMVHPNDRTEGLYGVFSHMSGGQPGLAHGMQEREVGISKVSTTDPSYHGYTHRATIKTVGSHIQDRLLFGPGKDPVIEGVGPDGSARRVTRIKPLKAQLHVATHALLHHTGLGPEYP